MIRLFPQNKRTYAQAIDARERGAGKIPGNEFFLAERVGDFDGKLVLAPQKQKPALWAGSLNSGARTRTNAAGVEQRACRAGPGGVSRRAANNRTEFDGESARRKAKTQP